MTIEEFVERYPRLWHMAEIENWPLIQEHGLLSTSALLDLFEYRGAERDAIESAYRDESIQIHHPDLGVAVVRDQKPMGNDERVARFLDEMTPAEWYRHLNSRVFFWVTEQRLERLLAAGAYRERAHTVLVVETAGLFERHLEEITLSPINSGAIFPAGTTRRGPQTFSRFTVYPWQERLHRSEPVVELAVDSSVPDIMDLVREVCDRQSPPKQ